MIREHIEKLINHYDHNNPWLIGKWHKELETQVYVTPGTDDQKHDTRPNCWKDKHHTWHQIRIPRNANSEPTFSDYTPKFPLSEYVESVGTTWWNWVRRESEAVVYDFDSIVGHKAGLSKAILNKIIEKLKKVPYVTIYKSTSGNGYHVKVRFDPNDRPKTANHNEHTLVAEVVLQMMSEDADFDLADKVDCYGMIGWIWSTRATKDSGGFEMVQEATKELTSAEIPDWKSLPAKRMRTRPRVVAFDESGAEVEENNILGFTDEVVPLDDDHRKIIKALEKTKFNFQYVADHNLFHTHTTALKQVHQQLGLKGPFETDTSGSTLGNCYIRPLTGGGFSVFRFGKGTTEHAIWDQSTPTTWCSYNQVVPPHNLLLRLGAQYISENKHYEFEHHKSLVAAVDLLGNRVPLKLINDRDYQLHITGRGMVIKCICEAEVTPADCDGWVRGRGHSKKVLSRLEEIDEASILSHTDKLVRFMVRDGKNYGYAIKTSAGWIECKVDDAKRLTEHYVGGAESKLLVGTALANPWQIVNKPFEREHLPNREWNRKAAQLAQPCAPEAGPHPHWDLMLNHIGQSWDEPLRNDVEMQKYGINTGADYLRAWIACMIRFPESPLPYIFLVGHQNTGKSLVHEVLRECIVNGVVHGGNAITSGSGFNGEFEGKILAAIDETDLSEHTGTAAKLKSWTNATTISIHKKGFQPYDVKNFMKFIQTANSVQALMLEHGDTRIVIGEVPRFAGEEIPKEIFIDKCKAELPNFLYTLGTMLLPPMAGRTRLPVIVTEIKSDMLQSSEPDSLSFIEASYHKADGQQVKLKDAYKAYKIWCSVESKPVCALNDFKLQIALRYPVLMGPRGRALHVGNLSLNPADEAHPKGAFSLHGKEGRHERI